MLAYQNRDREGAAGAAATRQQGNGQKKGSGIFFHIAYLPQSVVFDAEKDS
jgi:hypothetical protein